MKTLTRAAAVTAAALLTMGTAGTAVAAPGDHGKGVGGCIDQLYGNATNERDSGHGVLPSQSPGPWLNNTGDPDNPFPGPSLGDYIQRYDFNPSDLRGIPCPFATP